MKGQEAVTLLLHIVEDENALLLGYQASGGRLMAERVRRALRSSFELQWILKYNWRRTHAFLVARRINVVCGNVLD